MSPSQTIRLVGTVTHRMISAELQTRWTVEVIGSGPDASVEGETAGRVGEEPISTIA